MNNNHENEMIRNPSPLPQENQLDDYIFLLVEILTSPIKERSQENIEILKPLINNIPLIKNNELLQNSNKEGVLDQICQILNCEIK